MLGTRALIVHGNLAIRQALAGRLSTRFHSVAITASSRAAAAQLTTMEPLSFALVDIDGVSDGFWVALAAAARRPLPVVVVTYTDALDIERAYALGRAGVHRLEREPIDLDSLIGVVAAGVDAEIAQIASSTAVAYACRARVLRTLVGARHQSRRATRLARIEQQRPFVRRA